MEHSNDFIVTLVAGLVLAFIFGLLAQRLKLSPLIGYLLAGVLCGPYTPGFVADSDLAGQMAEIGVILLMFGVGLHFSPKDLLAVRGVALPGALVQITVATALGFGLGMLAGFGAFESFLFGFALSVASTVVLLRALEDRGALHTEDGKIAVGWLIVEDLAMILALVMIPAIIQVSNNGGSLASIGPAITLTVGKMALFIVLMMVIGTRILPKVLIWIAKLRSRELFTLGVVAIALGIAFAASTWFGASFALGAFLAGLVLSESEISHKAAERTLPLSDIFSVLFFVSVGMLFDPSILITEPLLVLGVVFIIMIGKSLAALLIIKAFKKPLSTGMTIAASLAQIGEFSFILAGVGLHAGVLSQDANGLILAGALISIALNPFFFRGLEWLGRKLQPVTPVEAT
jgi:CPA2 family monovalent cation:H+ antiporter-2